MIRLAFPEWKDVKQPSDSKVGGGGQMLYQEGHRRSDLRKMRKKVKSSVEVQRLGHHYSDVLSRSQQQSWRLSK